MASEREERNHQNHSMNPDVYREPLECTDFGDTYRWWMEGARTPLRPPVKGTAFDQVLDHAIKTRGGVPIALGATAMPGEPLTIAQIRAMIDAVRPEVTVAVHESFDISAVPPLDGVTIVHSSLVPEGTAYLFKDHHLPPSQDWR